MIITFVYSIPLKTGETNLNIYEREFQERILLNKYFKSKLYPSQVVLDSEDDIIYFENEQMCDLLINNSCLNNLCSPKLFINNIDILIENIDEQINVIYYYMPKMSILENEIVVIIEKLRLIDDEYWFIVFDFLSNLRIQINNICHNNYYKLLRLYMKINRLKSDSLFKYKTILESIRKYDSIRKAYDEINKPTHIYSNINLEKIEFNNIGRYKVQKIFEYLEMEYDYILNSYGIESM